MRTRLTLGYCLMALIAVVASALVTLHVGGRGAEAEAGRRLGTASSFATSLLTAERDRNRSDALEIASRTTIQQGVAARDGALLTRQLTALRQTLRDDLLAIYRVDGTLLASDMLPELRLDEPPGLVRGALGGSATTATIVMGGHMMMAAAAPVMINNDISGAVLAADTLDERYARRLAMVTDLTVILAIENGAVISSEPINGTPLTADNWSSLRGRGDLRLTLTTTAQPQRALARPLLGADNRPVGAMVVAVPESLLTPIEPTDLPLYFALSGGLLIALWMLGAIVAWGQALRLPSAARPALNGSLVAATLDGHAGDAPVYRLSGVRHLPGLTIDRGRRQVAVDDRLVTLTATEFDLLWALAIEPGQVVTREALLGHLRGDDWQSEPGLLDTHVSNLRRKIEPDPAHPRYVLTVRGVGYKLADA